MLRVLVAVLEQEVALDALEEEVDVQVLHEPAVVELADERVLLLEVGHAALAAHHARHVLEVAHQRAVELGLLLLLLPQQLLAQQLLELHPLRLVQHQDLLEQPRDLRRRHEGIDQAVHLLLRVVLDLHRLVGEEPQPNLAQVPHQLVLGV